jgi:hypothetical protein
MEHAMPVSWLLAQCTEQRHDDARADARSMAERARAAGVARSAAMPFFIAAIVTTANAC